MVDLEIDDEEIRYVDEKRGINATIRAKVPDGSMKWIVLVILTIFLGIENFENFVP